MSGETRDKYGEAVPRWNVPKAARHCGLTDGDEDYNEYCRLNPSHLGVNTHVIYKWQHPVNKRVSKEVSECHEWDQWKEDNPDWQRDFTDPETLTRYGSRSW